jgi:glycosyltransferase involved in cell wall biosynthesis
VTTRVIYDHQTFSIQEYGGISRYFHEIVSRIAKSPDYDPEIVCPFYINEYFKDYPENCGLVKGFKIKRLPKTNTIRDLLNQQLSNLIVSMSAPKIIHETYYATTGIGSNKAKRVITVYDMIHEKFSADIDPDNGNARIKEAAIKRADHIICISENTRTDLIEILGIDQSKVSTIHIACAPNQNLIDSTLLQQDVNLKAQLGQPYLLYVGKRDPYKNFLRLLEVYHRSDQLQQDFRLICFGGGKFSSSELEQINTFQLQSKVIQIPGDDSTLAHLYRQAAVFVYPSLYEGFGIPPLEAMAFDCPVVCSNVSSIPEVVGDAGEYFDPYDLDSMLQAIELVVYSQARSNHLRKLGQDRIKLFSWDLCAAQTMEVYLSLL